MASLLEYVGCVHIYLGPYRGNPIALYLKRSDHGCRIGPKAYPWNDVVGIGETPNKAAADFEEKWKGKGLTADLYSGPSWEGGIKPEKPAPPKPAAPPKPPATPAASSQPAAPASTSQPSASPKPAAPTPATASPQTTEPAQPGTRPVSPPSGAQKTPVPPTTAPAASPQKTVPPQSGAGPTSPPSPGAEETPSSEAPVSPRGTRKSAS